jgi:hypothetical protein
MFHGIRKTVMALAALAALALGGSALAGAATHPTGSGLALRHPGIRNVAMQDLTPF